jgi:GT2 family glycosyltransferase
LLPELLSALATQTLPAADFEVVIIDNSPELLVGERAESPASRHLGCRIFRSSPPGLSRARNVALKACRTDYLVYIDDDAVPDPGWLEQIVSAFDARPRRGVVFGPIAPVWMQRKPGWLSDGLVAALAVLDYGAEDRETGPNENGFGANLAFRTACLHAIGGFNEQLGRVGRAVLLSNEEIVAQDQARRGGWEIFYAAGARVRHKIRPERLDRDWFRSRATWQAVSDVLRNAERQKDELMQIVQDPSAAARLLHYSHLFTSVSNEDFGQQLVAIRELVLLLLLASSVEAGAIETSFGAARHWLGDGDRPDAGLYKRDLDERYLALLGERAWLARDRDRVSQRLSESDAWAHELSCSVEDLTSRLAASDAWAKDLSEAYARADADRKALTAQVRELNDLVNTAGQKLLASDGRPYELNRTVTMLETEREDLATQVEKLRSLLALAEHRLAESERRGRE